MPAREPSILNSKHLNKWSLFAIIVVPMCIAAVLKTTTADLATPAGVGTMITFSVRLAVPWLFLAFGSSSLYVVFPGTFSLWLLRNQRIMGLCFATGMAWQLFFILILTTVHYDYYMAEENGIHSLVERVPGYLFIFAMTLTSFRFGRSKLSPRQWKLLHKSGIYFIWGVLFSAYWYELFYYDDIQVIDYVYFWLGFAAWGIRMLAWTRKRALRPVAT